VNWFFSLHAKVKSKYRQSILNIRNSLSSSEVSSLSKEIVKNVNTEFSLDEVGILGSYFSVNNEVDLTAINKKRLNKNRLTTYPKIGPNHSMNLIATKNFKQLIKNKYDIYEPSDGDVINSMEHEIIIIPTVGVDKNGYRLGYGGGYYDRYLESVHKNSNRPLLIGLIYDFQFIDDSIDETHDTRLDVVFSETQSKNFVS
tara:strand:- start:29 stop:628 length:600 start_codon:yes stop_codon:yes gene_type:complete